MKSLFALFLAVFAAAAQAAATVEVWKDPNCGCCSGWVEHLRSAGFNVRALDVADLDAARKKNGVPAELAACHTARAGGYAIEGHVPAEDIKRLLREKPQAAGIAVPGMPAGSPGMEVPGATKPYQTLLFRADGTARAWQTHAPNGHLVVAQASQAELSDGEVRRVDKDAKKITLRHGPLANLDMPAMTMVFQVKDPAMLEQVKPGDKVKFRAEKIGGAYTVTRIEAAR